MKWLKSKTLWSLVLLGAPNAIPAIRDQIPGVAGQALDVVLMLIGVYGRLNPRVK